MTPSKYLVLLFLILHAGVAAGQVARLSVNNPNPRVGDIVTIEFSLIDTTGSTLKDINRVDPSKGLDTLRNGWGEIRVRKVIPKAGKYKVGPFSFEINGVVYKSDTLIIPVAEKLPEAREGFWIRQVKWNGNNYLIFEQRIDLAKRKSVKERMNYDFADLGDKVWDQTNEIYFRHVFFTYPSQPHEDKMTEQIVAGAPEVVYSIHVYQVIKGKQYSGLTLTKKSFENFPPGIEFPDFFVR